MRNDIDIDFIKWMCEKAEGFKLSELKDHLYAPSCTHSFHLPTLRWDMDTKWTALVYPLLLQRAIEGINKLHLNGNKYPTILFDAYDLEIRYNTTSWKNKNYSFDCYETMDEIKEAALKYIYEQEKNNELF